MRERILSKPIFSIAGSSSVVIVSASLASVRSRRTRRRIPFCRLYGRARSSLVLLAAKISPANDWRRSGSELDSRYSCRRRPLPHRYRPAYVVVADQLQHQIDGRVREHAARIRLDRYTRLDDRPGFAEALKSFLGADAAALDGEKTPGTIQRIGICGEAARGQQRRGNAIFRGAADMERLGHGAEVTADAGGEAGGDAKAAAQLIALQSKSFAAAA